MRAHIAQRRPGLGQCRPNLAQHGPDLAQHKPKMGPRWLNMGPRLGPTWAQPALNIGPNCFHTGKHCAVCLPQFNIALPEFARRISAQSSHTISQTSLLDRRPAVRRKPLNPGAGHGARVLAGGLRWEPKVIKRLRATAGQGPMLRW